jgi:hypothetical protein
MRLTCPGDHDDVDVETPVAHVERTRAELDFGVVLTGFA